MNKSLIFLIALFSMTSTALAQRPNRQLTPEQMRARQEARQAELDAAEPVSYTHLRAHET